MSKSAAKPPMPAAETPGGTARGLLRSAWKATLGTIARDGGHPYASLVAVATEPDGTPLLLLSGLAEHTRNLKADQRASLLIDGTARGRGALTGARVTLVGALAPTRSETARRRYLARHPDAAQFIDFGDFDLYALDVSWAHLVAGFGRIERLKREDVILPTAGVEALIAAEESILEHMNTDHADTLTLLAGAAADPAVREEAEIGGNRQPWQMVGCDIEGIDLACRDGAARRVFPRCIKSPDEARRALAAMVKAARTKAVK